MTHLTARHFLLAGLAVAVVVLCAGTAQARQEHVVQRGGSHSTDQQPRLKPPRGLTIVAADKTSLKIRWQAVRHALKYEVYRSGGRLMSVKRPSVTLRRLACGTSYVIKVEAVDGAGRRSPKAAIASATRSCSYPPPTWFVSAAGSDSSRCSHSAPCRSFNRAYHSARPGDVVQVEGGTYPQQDITADSSKSSSADVVFVPEPGKVVTIGCHTLGAVDGTVLAGASCIDESASHITFDGGLNQGFRSPTYSVKGFSYQGRFDAERGARDITFTNMDVGSFAIGSSQTTISHNDIGPSVDPLNNRQADGDGDVWSDNLIHDFPIKNGGHFECVTWDAGTNVTFAHNEFRSCAIFAIFSKPDNATSGRIDHNAFWNPTTVQTNDDIKVSNGAGAPRCEDTITNNWISNGIDLSTAPCSGAVDGGGNTHHSPRTRPPSPIRH